MILAYALLGGLYLLVVPLALFFWMNSRWTRMGKVERLLVYGLVFFFFPGMVLFAPCLNYRMHKRFRQNELHSAHANDFITRRSLDQHDPHIANDRDLVHATG